MNDLTHFIQNFVWNDLNWSSTAMVRNDKGKEERI